MKIVIVANGKLPAIKYGGTERVVWYLGKELHKMGHEVTFLAGPGSYSPFGKVIERNPEVSLTSQIPIDTDIVHFNAAMRGEYLDKPHILTIHGNEAPNLQTRNVVFVSRNHAERFGSDQYVYNGLDWDDYGAADLTKKRDRFHFLGRADWKVKNVKGAIAVVKALKGETMTVLGGNRCSFKYSFRITTSPRIKFAGMVDDAGKKPVIEQSKGLIFPVKWHEPFGLAITESLYFGAPVFGTTYGALPELVTPEVGFLSISQSELVDHIRDDYHYSPQVCHDYAVEKFNSRVMAEEYLKKYEAVLNGATLNKDIPERKEWYKHLEWQK